MSAVQAMLVHVRTAPLPFARSPAAQECTRAELNTKGVPTRTKTGVINDEKGTLRTRCNEESQALAVPPSPALSGGAGEQSAVSGTTGPEDNRAALSHSCDLSGGQRASNGSNRHAISNPAPQRRVVLIDGDVDQLRSQGLRHDVHALQHVSHLQEQPHVLPLQEQQDPWASLPSHAEGRRGGDSEGSRLGMANARLQRFGLRSAQQRSDPRSAQGQAHAAHQAARLGVSPGRRAQGVLLPRPQTSLADEALRHPSGRRSCMSDFASTDRDLVHPHPPRARSSLGLSMALQHDTDIQDKGSRCKTSIPRARSSWDSSSSRWYWCRQTCAPGTFASRVGTAHASVRSSGSRRDLTKGQEAAARPLWRDHQDPQYHTQAQGAVSAPGVNLHLGRVPQAQRAAQAETQRVDRRSLDGRLDAFCGVRLAVTACLILACHSHCHILSC